MLLGMHLTPPRPDCACLHHQGKHVVPQAISRFRPATHVHGGVDKTLLLCHRKFHFPGVNLPELVQQVCAACQVCQETRPMSSEGTTR